MSLPQPPPSPGFGGPRRKGVKPHPRLPLSAFSPPNSGTLESFPLPPSPSTVHPKSVIDAHLFAQSGDLDLVQWKAHAGQLLSSRIGGAVLFLPEAGIAEAIEHIALNKSDISIISLAVPFNLEDGERVTRSYLSEPSIPISFTTTFAGSTPEGIENLRWALERARPVDIDIQATISDVVLEGLEDLITKATVGLSKAPPIILSNILPPPHDLELPIVKLMNHPTYLAFQSQTAALSLFPDVYIKFLPPSWDEPTPPTPSGEAHEDADHKQKKEWKRRIKMYLGPVIEAFGYQRIIFGSSPSPTSKGSSVASDWYELARESLAELGVEQETIDAVFYGNAKKVYGSA